MKPQKVNFVRETPEREDTGIFQVRLETGVALQVCENGSGKGSDGKIYFPILQEFRETFEGRPDIVARVIGWSSEIEREQILPPEN